MLRVKRQSSPRRIGRRSQRDVHGGHAENRLSTPVARDRRDAEPVEERGEVLLLRKLIGLERPNDRLFQRTARQQVLEHVEVAVEPTVHGHEVADLRVVRAEVLVHHVVGPHPGVDKLLEEVEHERRVGDGGDGGDPLIDQALEVAFESGKISTSLLQRRLSVGYGRAAKIIDKMEELGYVSAPEGQKPRQLLITKQDYMEMKLRKEDEE